MDAVGAGDGAEPADAPEERDREAAMDEAVVDDDVREPERGRPDPDPVEDLANDPRRPDAAVEDQRDRGRYVERAQRVVALERSLAPGVMRAVDRPEEAMPHLAVKERGPEVHQHRDQQGDRQPDDDGREAHP
jgi:hypothetical protein